jgi:hypothetical protein
LLSIRGTSGFFCRKGFGSSPIAVIRESLEVRGQKAAHLHPTGSVTVPPMVRVARRQPRTKITRRPVKPGLNQRQVAEMTGIHQSQLLRLEKGEIDRPPLAHLVNLAMVPEIEDPLDFAEDSWAHWQVPDARSEKPPPRKHRVS